MNRSNTLVWIDLEMTGLNPHTDRIIEIATLVTDSSLDTVIEGPSLVIHVEDSYLQNMAPEVQAMHMSSGLIDRVRESTTTLEEATAQTISFLKNYCDPGVSPLCGSSVWCDRQFLVRDMPAVIAMLHYRIIDVSTVKELITRWYPQNSHAHFQKKDRHRALEDIRESIDALKQYRRYFFVPSF